MIIIIVSILIIFCVLFSFGKIAVNFYSKIVKREEENSIVEVFFIGMMFVTLLLGLISIFTPINHNVFVIFFIVALFYLFFNIKDLNGYIRTNVNLISNKSNSIILIIAFFSLLLILLYPLLGQSTIDSVTYHIPSIRWAECFKLTPGIANLEERIGFNSNYILLSSLFTFRFFTGEGQYLLNIVAVLLIYSWLFKEVILNKMEIKRVTLLVLFTVLLWTQPLYLISTWTDTLPNIIIFYIIARALLYPALQERKVLFHLLVGIALITFKVSFAVVSIGLGLYYLVYFVRRKDYKSIAFFSFYAVLFVGCWLLRNVVISGYLVFPVYQIDWFDVDWKVPLSIAQTEQKFINDAGGLLPLIGLHYAVWYNLQNFSTTINVLHDISAYITLWLTLFTLPLGVFYIIKSKERNYFIITLFIIIMLSIVYWLFSAPYFRFIGGVIFSANIFFFFLLFDFIKIKRISSLIYYPLLVISLILFINRTNKYVIISDLLGDSLYLYKPKKLSDKIKVDIENIKITLLKLNDSISIQLIHDTSIYEYIPAVTSREIGSGHFQSHRAVEARGCRITDGFRYNMSKE